METFQICASIFLAQSDSQVSAKLVWQRKWCTLKDEIIETRGLDIKTTPFGQFGS